VPQLEEELRVEEIQIRLMATQVLGEMFADKGGTEFMKQYPSTWTFWVARRNDKAPAVRVAFVEASKGLLSGTGEMRSIIEGMLYL
jgi:sister-chromatid-cohesion protein PDS5